MTEENHAKAAEAIIDFAWHNYGLDNVAETKDGDWADDLASFVLAAIHPDPLSDEQCERIHNDVSTHPRRDLIEEIAEVTYDLDGEDGGGAGKLVHLRLAHTLVESLPGLRLDPTA